MRITEKEFQALINEIDLEIIHSKNEVNPWVHFFIGSKDSHFKIPLGKYSKKPHSVLHKDSNLGWGVNWRASVWR